MAADLSFNVPVQFKMDVITVGAESFKAAVRVSVNPAVETNVIHLTHRDFSLSEWDAFNETLLKLQTGGKAVLEDAERIFRFQVIREKGAYFLGVRCVEDEVVKEAGGQYVMQYEAKLGFDELVLIQETFRDFGDIRES